jgi:hypothetical protein
MLDVYGSKHSLLPKIWLVDAVGMGANKREFLTPFFAILCRNAGQSQRSDGTAFHISGCKIPYIQLTINVQSHNLFICKVKETQYQYIEFG